MAAEIIQFPVKNKLLDLMERVELEQQQDPVEISVDKATEILGASFVDHLVSLGYPIQKTHTKDICFVIESMRSLVKKFYGQEHAFQPLAKMSFHTASNGAMTFSSPNVRVTTKKEANSSPK